MWKRQPKINLIQPYDNFHLNAAIQENKIDLYFTFSTVYVSMDGGGGGRVIEEIGELSSVEFLHGDPHTKFIAGFEQVVVAL
jgi:hypothetical protein